MRRFQPRNDARRMIERDRSGIIISSGDFTGIKDDRSSVKDRAASREKDLTRSFFAQTPAFEIFRETRIALFLARGAER